MTETPETALEAAAFRRLVSHLQNRTDVQNIDMMNLAGFCRNCLSRWYREEAAEMGIEVELTEDAPIITQRIFTNEGISFVSFTYQASWDGDDSQIKLKENEISQFEWLSPSEAISRAVSGFDVAALRHL